MQLHGTHSLKLAGHGFSHIQWSSAAGGLVSAGVHAVRKLAWLLMLPALAHHKAEVAPSILRYQALPFRRSPKGFKVTSLSASMYLYALKP